MRVATRVTGGLSGVGDVSLMRVDIGNEGREKVDDRRRRRPTAGARSCRGHHARSPREPPVSPPARTPAPSPGSGPARSPRGSWGGGTRLRRASGRAQLFSSRRRSTRRADPATSAPASARAPSADVFQPITSAGLGHELVARAAAHGGQSISL